MLYCNRRFQCSPPFSIYVMYVEVPVFCTKVVHNLFSKSKITRFSESGRIQSPLVTLGANGKSCFENSKKSGAGIVVYNNLYIIYAFIIVYAKIHRSYGSGSFLLTLK